VQEAGRALFEKMGCLTCHRVGEQGGTRGPDLTHFASRPDAGERVLLHFSGIAQTPGSSMPAYQLSPEELSSLSEYLMTLK
jgi:mono/diheme cytochrome c family protein